MAVTIDHLTKAYLERRDTLSAMNDAHTLNTAKVKEEMQKLETALMFKLDEQGSTSAKTIYGTPYKQKWEGTKVKDREAFFAWVKENDRFDALPASCTKTIVLEEDELPPGIEYTSGYKVNVRSAAK